MQARRGRTLLAAAGIIAAAAMVGAGVTVAYGLGTGFERTANKAHLPDVLAIFNTVPRSKVERVTGALPNIRAASLRLQSSGEHVRVGARVERHATVIGVPTGLQGYAVVAGHALTGRRDEAVVEVGLARAWNLRVGEELRVEDFRGGSDRWRIVGFALSPDTVAYPLAKGPRIYTNYRELERLIRAPDGSVNSVALWLNDPRRVDVTLAQARSASIGLAGLTFVTRTGMRLLIGQAAGIVVGLLVAFSVAALLVAFAMLASSAAAEVARRAEGIALLRALGATPGAIVAAAALEAALVAVPAAALGLIGGWAAVAGPSGRLLGALNQLGPGSAVSLPLAACLAALTFLVVVATVIPTWRATRRPTIDALRHGDVLGRVVRVPGLAGVAGLGVRLALARPLRTLGAVLVLGAATAVVLLILSIASVLLHLDQSPVALGKHYQLTVAGTAQAVPEIAALHGVTGAAARYELEVADSFRLAEPFTLIAFADPSPVAYESPALAAGRRRARRDEAEVGVGLASALGLHPGATLAAQLPNGGELRFRVSGVDRVLQDQGRVAYVSAAALLAGAPLLAPSLAIRVATGASVGSVERELKARGFLPSSSGGIAGQSVQGFAGRNGGFLTTLVSVLRSVAVLNTAVCIYVIAQALALTAYERRRAVALIRSVGASRTQVAALFMSTAALIALLAAPLGVALERFALGPGVARAAASYVTLSLEATGATVLLTIGGLVAGSLLVAASVGRLATAQPVARGLRED